MDERIGVVGLGRMGWALAERFAGQGCEVVGWTRSGFESSKAEESGFAPSETLGELVSSSDIVFLSLFDEIAVRDVLGQLAVLDLERKLIVETSTVSPNVCRQLESSINAAGGALIDAPISGGPEMVRSGDMGLFIGGSDVAANRRDRALLGRDLTGRLLQCRQLTSRDDHMGGSLYPLKGSIRWILLP